MSVAPLLIAENLIVYFGCDGLDTLLGDPPSAATPKAHRDYSLSTGRERKMPAQRDHPGSGLRPVVHRDTAPGPQRYAETSPPSAQARPQRPQPDTRPERDLSGNTGMLLVTPALAEET